jgi:hypothetical protein
MPIANLDNHNNRIILVVQAALVPSVHSMTGIFLITKAESTMMDPK